MTDNSDDSTGKDVHIFQRDLHLQYFNWMLQELPGAYSGEESSRLTLAYFVISALDVLGAIDQVAVEDTIAWVYGLQVLPLSKDGSFVSAVMTDDLQGHGLAMWKFVTTGRWYYHLSIALKALPLPHDGGHLAMTYSALAILTILGDDFSRVSREAILKSLQLLQQPDGSFSPIHMDKQTDLRFVFCAAAISVMLNDWSGMDRQRAVDFILKSQSYDGGFSLSPDLECHVCAVTTVWGKNCTHQGSERLEAFGTFPRGATYCGLSALWLITRFDPDWPSSEPLGSLINFENAMSWCLQRQVKCGGFQGRPNKPADTCYAFWIGGALRMFGMDKLCDQEALRAFLLSCQSKWGGFSKFPNEGFPDLLHSYYGVCGFSLLGEPGLNTLSFGLGLTCQSASRLPVFKERLAGTVGLESHFSNLQVGAI